MIESTRLLRIQLTTDLRCLKVLDAKKNENSENFCFKEIRSVCEMACQVFHSGLTKQQTKDIENIQNKSLKIILGDIYSSYEEACTLLTAEPLSDRRQTQCVNFVKRTVKGLHSDIGCCALFSTICFLINL